MATKRPLAEGLKPLSTLNPQTTPAVSPTTSPSNNGTKIHMPRGAGNESVSQGSNGGAKDDKDTKVKKVRMRKKKVVGVIAA